ARVAGETLALPVDVVATETVEVGAVEHAGEDEEQVAQPVEVLACFAANGVAAGQRDDRALGAAGDRSADVGKRRAARAGRQDEFLEARQRRVVVSKRFV